MITFPCCCCFSCENTENETQPLLGSSEQNGAASARQTLSAQSDGHKRSGKLVMRRVGVPDLDQRFSDVAETFNEQQHRSDTTAHLLLNLQKRYGCSPGGTLALTGILRKIREEHEAKYRISMKLKGYDFSLCVIQAKSDENDAEPLPYHLQRAIDEFKDISESAKVTIAKGTTLQELMGWLLRSKDHMAEQVKGAAATFQEQGRLSENLEENMKEVMRAKRLSMEYRQKAGELFIEAADIAGPHL
ncbi:hypothetical protein NQD34_008361 [Periophthalmus magnuspinnatus]|uniref:uncharacterized protein si:ch73-345f18.3 n=1 Tax=Periophthalmus magnuspinnatus TaxID=409849 RepID=UPI00145BF285|nr:uncharacterized protein si:ch73-345f18.3 [Periophthalmus magnuspinnatus]KAJ0003263.1 hypothetical protein NQD34_008361 [Periophthalmus magnuspinnatus]